MKINRKIYSILVILFSVITLCLGVLFVLNYVDIYIMLIFVGFTTVFGGLSEIDRVQQINSKGISKGNKKGGIFSVIVGTFLIIQMMVVHFIHL